MLGNNASIQNAAHALQPIEPSERILALDVLRGFALFGVLVAYALWNLGTPPEQTYGEVDRFLDRVLSALVDTKAHTLFAIMVFSMNQSWVLSPLPGSVTTRPWVSVRNLSKPWFSTLYAGGPSTRPLAMNGR